MKKSLERVTKLLAMSILSAYSVKLKYRFIYQKYHLTEARLLKEMVDSRNGLKMYKVSLEPP